VPVRVVMAIPMIITWLQLVTMIVAMIIFMIISMIVAVIVTVVITILALVNILFLVQRLVGMHGLVFVVNNLVDTVGMWLHDLLFEDNPLLERLSLVDGLQDVRMVSLLDFTTGLTLCLASTYTGFSTYLGMYS